MNVILAVPLIISTLLLLFRSIKFRTYDFFVWLLLLPFFAIPYFFDSLFLADKLTNEALFYAGICALIFNLSFFVTIKYIVRKRINIPTLTERSSSFKFSLFLCLVLSVLLLLLHIYISFGISISNIQAVFLMSFREVSLDDATIYRDISHRLAVIGAMTFGVYLAGKNRIFTFFSFILISFYVLLEGTRWLIIPVIGPLIYIYITKRTFNTRGFFKLGFLGLLGLFLVFHMQTLRYTGDRSFTNVINIEVLSKTAERLIDFGDSKETASGEFRLRHYYYYLTKNMPDNHDFAIGTTYSRMLLVFVPTSKSFGLKSRDLTRDIADWIYPYRAGYGGTVHPLLYGESYANFGIFGGFLGIFWALLIGFVSRFIGTLQNNTQILILPVMSTFGIFLARGAVYSAFFFLISGFILVYFLKFISIFFQYKDGDKK